MAIHRESWGGGETPTKQMISAFVAQMKENIEKYGVHLTGVGAGDGKPPFTYTVGLHGRGLPEVLMMSLPPALSGSILNALSEMSANGVLQLGPGMVPIGTLLKEQPMWLLKVPQEEAVEWIGTALRYYETDDVELLQLVWPDKNGLFPWEEGFDPDYIERQPIIGKVPDNE